MRCSECLGNYYPSAGCETCRHPLERLFRFIGALGALHCAPDDVRLSWDARLAAAAKVLAAATRREHGAVFSVWDAIGVRDATIKLISRLADEAVGLVEVTP